MPRLGGCVQLTEVEAREVPLSLPNQLQCHHCPFGGRYRFRFQLLISSLALSAPGVDVHMLYHTHSLHGPADHCLHEGGSSEPPIPPDYGLVYIIHVIWYMYIHLTTH